MERIVKYSVEMEKVEKHFFPPVQLVFVSAVRYPLPSLAELYPASIQKAPEVVGNGDEGKSSSRKLEQCYSAMAHGQSAAVLFPTGPHPGWARKEVQPPSLQPCFPSSLHPCFLPRAASYLERAEMASGHLHSLTHMVTQPHPVELLVVSLKIALPKTKSPLWTLFLMSQEKAAVPTFLFNTEATASLTAVY